MGKSGTRREFLKQTASAGSVVPFVSRGHRQQADYLSATVVDMQGNPVPNAGVTVYNASESNSLFATSRVEELARTKTLNTGSRIGEFGITDFARDEFDRLRRENDRIVLTVAWPLLSTPGDVEWFGGVNLPAKNFFSERFLDENLRLRNEFLFAPASEQRFGTVVVWRQVGMESPREQTVFIELSRAEQLYYTGFDTAVKSGGFGLRVPEDVAVRYEDVDVWWTGPWNDRQGTQNGRLLFELANQLRSETEESIPMPLFPPLRRLAYERFTEADRELAEMERELIDGLLGLTPKVGTLKGIADLITKVLDIGERTAYTFGDGSETDRNAQDIVSGSWNTQTASVVFEVPIRIPESAQTPVQVAARGWWDVKTDVDPARLDAPAPMDTTIQPPGATPDDDGEMTVTGRILNPDGTPASNDTLQMYSEASSELVTGTHTGTDGRFSYTLPAQTPHHIQYYQLYDATPDTPAFDTRGTGGPTDGTPDLFLVRSLSGSGSRDLGSISLPPGYEVNLRVVDENGEPVPGEDVSVSHTQPGVGWFAYWNTSTDDDGWLRLENGDDRGIELNGEVGFSVRDQQRNLTVDGPRTLELAVG